MAARCVVREVMGVTLVEYPRSMPPKRLLLRAAPQGATQYAHLPSSSIYNIITCMTTGDSLMARRASYRGHVSTQIARMSLDHASLSVPRTQGRPVSARRIDLLLHKYKSSACTLVSPLLSVPATRARFRRPVSAHMCVRGLCRRPSTPFFVLVRVLVVRHDVPVTCRL